MNKYLFKNLYIIVHKYKYKYFRVVATQLSAELTKQIVITDPYRIKVY